MGSCSGGGKCILKYVLGPPEWLAAENPSPEGLFVLR